LPDNYSDINEAYFDVQASWGMTKHLGGLKATDKLVELCLITRDKHILVVGCGVGMTPCYLAQKYGCRVTGIDISEKMVEHAVDRAKKKNLQHLTEFRVADAQNLPFEDNTFDAVISESVNAFIPDKPKALSEYVRVVKKGGYVGFNEVTWLKPPPPDLEEYMFRIMGARFLTCENGWKELLEGSGVAKTQILIYKTNFISQWSDAVKQFDFPDFFKAWGRYFYMFFKSPVCRKFTREAMNFPISMFGLFKYFGYGLYVGSKPENT